MSIFYTKYSFLIVLKSLVLLVFYGSGVTTTPITIQYWVVFIFYVTSIRAMALIGNTDRHSYLAR